MERQAQNLAPQRAWCPKRVSVSSLPPHPNAYHKMRNPSYKGQGEGLVPQAQVHRLKFRMCTGSSRATTPAASPLTLPSPRLAEEAKRGEGSGQRCPAHTSLCITSLCAGWGGGQGCAPFRAHPKGLALTTAPCRAILARCNEGEPHSRRGQQTWLSLAAIAVGNSGGWGNKYTVPGARWRCTPPQSRSLTLSPSC